MATKTKSPTGVNVLVDINASKPKKSGKVRVQTLADFGAEALNPQLSDYVDATIYIVHIEPFVSETYGEGWRVDFKDLPNARDEMTVGTFAQVLSKQLAKLYHNSHDGKQINADFPVKVVVRKNGRTLMFE